MYNESEIIAEINYHAKLLLRVYDFDEKIMEENFDTLFLEADGLAEVKRIFGSVECIPSGFDYEDKKGFVTRYADLISAEVREKMLNIILIRGENA